MNNHLNILDNCSSYDELTKCLSDKPLIEAVQNKYVNCNSRILLSSFVIVKYPDIIHASDQLIVYAKEIMQRLQNNENINPNDVYFTEFENWRRDDSNKLEEEIHQGIQMLETMKVEQLNEADKDWNDGLHYNIEVMRKSINKLKSFSS
uniref:Uncharacterized protein n=1 Tax=viral metagenome TaxID=1070528 RepID=A0A6C0F8N7_9ZZZZ|tara:strand:- start:3227 stop:3673 length:447 start_codon:yes stop_codon:yes gene_type:complete